MFCVKLPEAHGNSIKYKRNKLVNVSVVLPVTNRDVLDVAMVRPSEGGKNYPTLDSRNSAARDILNTQKMRK